ncbi:hypothetical protein VP01_509g1 [Puccinia sorghi]|uniref:Uncharacterized protein n=1 Tax=Puccinia sorghi TaxID=27349 RepID=A0A0L6UL93_9BASI|nr:hypothetical protein VP01_509g1 [Puccinia sorghi]
MSDHGNSTMSTAHSFVASKIKTHQTQVTAQHLPLIVELLRCQKRSVTFQVLIQKRTPRTNYLPVNLPKISVEQELGIGEDISSNFGQASAQVSSLILSHDVCEAYLERGSSYEQPSYAPRIRMTPARIRRTSIRIISQTPVDASVVRDGSNGPAGVNVRNGGRDMAPAAGPSLRDISPTTSTFWISTGYDPACCSSRDSLPHLHGILPLRPAATGSIRDMPRHKGESTAPPRDIFPSVDSHARPAAPIARRGLKKETIGRRTRKEKKKTGYDPIKGPSHRTSPNPFHSSSYWHLRPRLTIGATALVCKSTPRHISRGDGVDSGSCRGIYLEGMASTRDHAGPYPVEIHGRRPHLPGKGLIFMGYISLSTGVNSVLRGCSPEYKRCQWNGIIAPSTCILRSWRAKAWTHIHLRRRQLYHREVSIRMAKDLIVNPTIKMHGFYFRRTDVPQRYHLTSLCTSFVTSTRALHIWKGGDEISLGFWCVGRMNAYLRYIREQSSKLQRAYCRTSWPHQNMFPDVGQRNYTRNNRHIKPLLSLLEYFVLGFQSVWIEHELRRTLTIWTDGTREGEEGIRLQYRSMALMMCLATLSGKREKCSAGKPCKGLKTIGRRGKLRGRARPFMLRPRPGRRSSRDAELSGLSLWPSTVCQCSAQTAIARLAWYAFRLRAVPPQFNMGLCSLLSILAVVHLYTLNDLSMGSWPAFPNPLLQSRAMDSPVLSCYPVHLGECAFRFYFESSHTEQQRHSEGTQGMVIQLNNSFVSMFSLFINPSWAQDIVRLCGHQPSNKTCGSASSPMVFFVHRSTSCKRIESHKLPFGPASVLALVFKQQLQIFQHYCNGMVIDVRFFTRFLLGLFLTCNLRVPWGTLISNAPHELWLGRLKLLFRLFNYHCYHRLFPWLSSSHHQELNNVQHPSQKVANKKIAVSIISIPTSPLRDSLCVSFRFSIVLFTSNPINTSRPISLNSLRAVELRTNELKITSLKGHKQERRTQCTSVHGGQPEEFQADTHALPFRTRERRIRGDMTGAAVRCEENASSACSLPLQLRILSILRQPIVSSYSVFLIWSPVAPDPTRPELRVPKRTAPGPEIRKDQEAQWISNSRCALHTIKIIKMLFILGDLDFHCLYQMHMQGRY